MTKEALHKKEEKFFFNVNIFDEDEVEEIIEEEPPPPVFSEQQLEAAKQKGFQDGQQQAQKEHKESRDLEITKLLERMAGDMSSFFEKEKAREELYQQEVISLSTQIFEKLFPLYNETHGFDELQRAITDVLKKQEGQQSIAIFLSPGDAEAVEAHIEKIPVPETHKITVQQDETLQPGAWAMDWQDGGSTRNPAALADEIRALLQQMLAGTAAKGHDKEENNKPAEQDITETAAETPETPPEVQNQDPAADKTDLVEKPDE